MKNRFLRLSNEKSARLGFDRQRNVGGNNNTNQSKIIHEFQKENLRIDIQNFETSKNLRLQSRTIKLPKHIDLIQIHFFPYSIMIYKKNSVQNMD